MQKWTHGRVVVPQEPPAAWPPGRRPWVLLPLFALVCPPLALLLRGRLVAALLAGGVLAALWKWYVPELLFLSLLVWALVGLSTLVLVGGD